MDLKVAAAAMVCLVMTTVLSTAPTRAQTSQSCASELVPCASYLNTTTTPPASCCDSIKKAVNTELSCLCTLYNTPGLLQSFGVNLTQALGLSQRCGVNSTLSACSASAPSGSTTPPPGVSGNDGNRIALTGFSGLLVVLASFLLH